MLSRAKPNALLRNSQKPADGTIVIRALRLKAAGTQGGPGYWGVRKIAALYEATYFVGLRKAGMPEE
jgi:hypothetical protein